jgi:hypothetical protein
MLVQPRHAVQRPSRIAVGDGSHNIFWAKPVWIECTALTGLAARVTRAVPGLRPGLSPFALTGLGCPTLVCRNSPLQGSCNHAGLGCQISLLQGYCKRVGLTDFALTGLLQTCWAGLTDFALTELLQTCWAVGFRPYRAVANMLGNCAGTCVNLLGGQILPLQGCCKHARKLCPQASGSDSVRGIDCGQLGNCGAAKIVAPPPAGRINSLQAPGASRRFLEQS